MRVVVDSERIYARRYIAIVKKTFRLQKVFLLQPLMPPSFYPERIYDKRCKYDFLADKGVCFKEIHSKESIGNEEPRGAGQQP